MSEIEESRKLEKEGKQKKQEIIKVGNWKKYEISKSQKKVGNQKKQEV